MSKKYCESCKENADEKVLAKYKCRDCGMLLCEDCAESAEFVCECYIEQAPRNIYPIKKKGL